MIRAKKAGRKIASVILAAAVLVTAAVPAWASSETMPFRDVNEGDWYYDAASFMYEKGLMNGTSPDEFSPDTFITKEMFVTILGRLAEREGAALREKVNPIVRLLDISQGDYSRDYVYWADAVGITPPVEFAAEKVEAATQQVLERVYYWDTDEWIFRDQAAYMMAAFADELNITMPETVNLRLEDFADYSYMSNPYAFQWEGSDEALERCVRAGILKGYPNGMLMTGEEGFKWVTRAEAAQMIYNMYEILGIDA